MGLYHRDVGNGLPSNVIIPTGKIYLDPSGHALQEAQNDRYLEPHEDKLHIPQTVTLTEGNVFEVRADDAGVIRKLCCRVQYDDYRDLILALKPPETGGFDPMSPWTVKTVWVNVADDPHETLDESAYDNA